MIGCGELIERKFLRKVVSSKKRVNPRKTRRKEKTGVRKLFIPCASLHRCIHIPQRPHQVQPLNCYFQQLPFAIYRVTSDELDWKTKR